MKRTLIVGYDGSPASQRAVDHAADAAQALGLKLLLVHVLEWSPYAFLTPEELNERHKRREQELSRAREQIRPAVDALRGRGIDADTELRHGHAGELLCEIATSSGAAQIVIGRTGASALANRLLGGLALTLSQASPVPLTIVP